MSKAVNRIMLFLLSFFMIIIFIGCSSHKQIISAPEKIVIYRYGKAENYVDCSRGPLKSPASMINLVEDL